MKNLMRFLSVLIAFSGIVIVIALAFDTGTDFSNFAGNILGIFTANILPFVAIAICAFCLERNDNNYLIRIIPIYMCVPIVISIIRVVFNTNAEWLVEIYNFLSGTFVGVTVLALISVIKPNNQISKILKYIAYGIIMANVGLAIYAKIKSYMVETLPNVYGYNNYGGFNFPTELETELFLVKAYLVTTIGQIFVILLLYITNYAFGDKIEIIDDDIDYEAVKQDALNAANKQMENLYTKKEKEKEVDRSSSEKGLMNVNNQLGQDSNVGTVKEKAKEVNVSGSSLESLITLSNNPVINDSTNDTNNTEKVSETQPPTVQQNLDVQEQMKEKIQSQQNVNQQVQHQDINQPPVQQNINQ